MNKTATIRVEGKNREAFLNLMEKSMKFAKGEPDYDEKKDVYTYKFGIDKDVDGYRWFLVCLGKAKKEGILYGEEIRTVK